MYIVVYRFSVLVVVYLAAGSLFMKYGRGAEGKEVIPNVNIWMEIPGLIKVGNSAVISKYF